jgi:hypothetical protein
MPSPDLLLIGIALDEESFISKKKVDPTPKSAETPIRPSWCSMIVLETEAERERERQRERERDRQREREREREGQTSSRVREKG